MEFKETYLLYTYSETGMMEFDNKELAEALPYKSKHIYFGNDARYHLVHVYMEDDGQVAYERSIPKDKFITSAKEQVARIRLYLRENCNKSKDLPRFVTIPYLGMIHDTELPQLLRTMKQYLRENRS